MILCKINEFNEGANSILVSKLSKKVLELIRHEDRVLLACDFK